MQASASIDLVKSRTNLLEEFIKWALSLGRLLVIIVEIVAFSAFVWRFSLDRQLIDLNDKIKQEQAIVEASKSNEIKYRNLQQRLETVSLINVQGNKNYKILNDVIIMTPDEITFNSITIENGEIKLDTNIQSASSLTSYIKSLREYPQTSSVGIMSVKNGSGSSLVNVILAIKLKEGKNENNF